MPVEGIPLQETNKRKKIPPNTTRELIIIRRVQPPIPRLNLLTKKPPIRAPAIAEGTIT